MTRLDRCAVGWHRHRRALRQVAALSAGLWVWVDVPFEEPGWIVLSGVEKVADEQDMVWLLTSQGDKILYSAFAEVLTMEACDAR